MNPFPPDAVHETPESRLRAAPADTPEYGFGSWDNVNERFRRLRFVNDQWPPPAPAPTATNCAEPEPPAFL